MSEILKFREDWREFYNSLNEKQKENFNIFADKHANYQLNDCINEVEDYKVIVK